MKRFILFICCCLLTGVVFSQEADDSGEEEGGMPEIISSSYDFHEPGAMQMKVALGVDVPLFNQDADGRIIKNTGMHTGGLLSLLSTYFFTSSINMGFDAVFNFLPTTGSNLLFYVPLTVRGGYQFVWGKFEIPVNLGAGIAIQTCANRNYYGLILRPETGIYYRQGPDWSFGVGTVWNFIPQWYKDKNDTRYGNILEISAAVRFHF